MKHWNICLRSVTPSPAPRARHNILVDAPPSGQRFFEDVARFYFVLLCWEGVNQVCLFASTLHSMACNWLQGIL